jgi:transcriptional regulator with XRE-family HTH domain
MEATLDVDNQDRQRRALADFLRSRRERLTPQAAGVRTPLGRRRTSGLRREELAALAGVSLTWYTWLEQARRIKVSRQVLTGLAGALQLDPVETEYLFRLAGELPEAAEEEPGHDRPEVPAAYLGLLRLLDPLPAVIADHRFDALAWNEGFPVLFPHFEGLPEDERNLLLLTFDERSRDLYPQWEEHALHTVALFRAQAADRLTQPSYVRLLQQLGRRSESFRDLWQRMDLEAPGPARRSFDHPLLGRIDLDYVKLQLSDIDATLVIHLPLAEDGVLDRLRGLVDERRGAHAPSPALAITTSTSTSTSAATAAAVVAGVAALLQ